MKPTNIAGPHEELEAGLGCFHVRKIACRAPSSALGTEHWVVILTVILGTGWEAGEGSFSPADAVDGARRASLWAGRQGLSPTLPLTRCTTLVNILEC